MTVLNTTQHTAKKQHRCNYCGYIIEPKQQYFKSAIVNDGDFYVRKSHKCCNELIDKLDMFKYLDSGEGLTQDDFVQNVFNEYDRLSEVDGITSFKEKLDYVLMYNDIEK